MPYECHFTGKKTTFGKTRASGQKITKGGFWPQDHRHQPPGLPPQPPAGHCPRRRQAPAGHRFDQGRPHGSGRQAAQAEVRLHPPAEKEAEGN